MFLGLNSQTLADRSQAWVWDISDDKAFLFAVTANEAGNVVGQYCYLSTGNCLWIVSFGTYCEDGAKYPALVNTDNGSQSIELTCGKELKDGSSLMLFSDFDTMDNIVRSNSHVGFVMPMENNGFKAIRFSLKGSTGALDKMRAVALKMQSDKPARPDIKPAVERL